MILLKRDVWVRLDSSQALAWLTSTKFCLRLWRFLLLFIWVLVSPESLGSSMYTQSNVTQMLKQHEGIKLKTYKDTLGNLTVGYGHKVLPEDNLKEGDYITQDMANSWFTRDMAKAADFAKTIPGFAKMNPARQEVMIDLTFNMGSGWTKKFPSMYENIQAAAQAMPGSPEEKKAFQNAALELKYKDPFSDDNAQESDYYSQVGNRAVTNVNKLREGA